MTTSRIAQIANFISSKKSKIKLDISIDNYGSFQLRDNQIIDLLIMFRDSIDLEEDIKINYSSFLKHHE